MEGEPCEIFVMLSVDDASPAELRDEVARLSNHLQRMTRERDTWLDAAFRLNQQHYRTVLSAVTEQAREDTERLMKELENTRRRLKEVANLLDEPAYQRDAKVAARDRLSKR